MSDKERIQELETLLDHYRGQCQRCEREGVLLDFVSTYDEVEQVCLQDREECQRLHDELNRQKDEAFRAKVAAGDPRAVMIDRFNRSMLESYRASISHRPSDPVSGAKIQWVPEEWR